jgi:hypothetical protein
MTKQSIRGLIFFCPHACVPACLAGEICSTEDAGQTSNGIRQGKGRWEMIVVEWGGEGIDVKLKKRVFGLFS